MLHVLHERRHGFVDWPAKHLHPRANAGIVAIRVHVPPGGLHRDESAARSPDLVEREFSATAPDQLWVMDLTYVATWSGVAYVCFITDAFSRRIVGWRVAGHMRTEMVLDALEMARWTRATNLEGLIAHSDAGSQFTSVRYGERLAELGAVVTKSLLVDPWPGNPYS